MSSDLYPQVLYLLNQLQNKSIREELDETKQREERSKERELQQRLKVQVCQLLLALTDPWFKTRRTDLIVTMI